MMMSGGEEDRPRHLRAPRARVLLGERLGPGAPRGAAGCSPSRRSTPSTMMPKSIAPSESRLAGMLVRCIRMKAISSDSGMVMATMSAPRTLPRNRISTTHHERHALEQRARDGVQRGVHQVGAIEVRARRCTSGGKQPVVELVHLWRARPSSTARGILARAAAARCPKHRRGCRPCRGCRCAPARRAAARRGSCRKIGVPLLLGDDDVAEVVERADQADAAHDEALLAAHQDAAAGVGVVGLNRVDDLLAARGCTGRAWPDRAGAGTASVSPPKLVTSATPKTCLQRGDDHPVLQLLAARAARGCGTRACSGRSRRSARSAGRGPAVAPGGRSTPLMRSWMRWRAQ